MKIIKGKIMKESSKQEICDTCGEVVPGELFEGNPKYVVCGCGTVYFRIEDFCKYKDKCKYFDEEKLACTDKKVRNSCTSYHYKIYER